MQLFILQLKVYILFTSPNLFLLLVGIFPGFAWNSLEQGPVAAGHFSKRVPSKNCINQSEEEKRTHVFKKNLLANLKALDAKQLKT